MRIAQLAKYLIGLALGGVVLAGCETSGSTAAAPALSVDDYAETLIVRDSTGHTAISSQQSYVSGNPNYSEASDAFLISEVDRSDGTAAYVVYVTFSRRTPDWPTPFRAQFGDPAQTVDADRVDGDINCANADEGAGRHCLRIESAAFEVPLAELQRAAASDSDVWPFTIKNRSSYDLNTSLPVDEIRAVLERAQAAANR